MFMVTQLSRTKYVHTQIFKNLDSEIIERQRCDRYRILDCVRHARHAGPEALRQVQTQAQLQETLFRRENRLTQ